MPAGLTRVLKSFGSSQIILISVKEVLTMAVPKRKTSRARRDKRRSNLWKLSAPALVKCSQCGEFRRTHRVCGNCGYYKGRLVVKKEA